MESGGPMRKVVIITNIPAPYRVDLFYYMQTHIKKYKLYIVYTNISEDNRKWKIKEDRLINTQILSSKIIKIKKRFDNRYIHLPGNLLKVLNKLLPDIIIAFEYNPAALQSLLWCRIHKKKFIHLTDGTLYSERNIGKIQKAARKIILRNADACIASSTKAKEKLLAWGVKEESIFISLLTVDNASYKEMEKDVQRGRLLYVGSMIKRKGIDLLFNALPYIKGNYNLHIVGNGTREEIEELKKIAMEKGIAEKITWCGFKEGKELLDEYRQASVFVLPTREDCFGLVLLEALYAKVPIVSSKYADGAYDIVENGVNGYIVNPFCEEELAKAIEKALNNLRLNDRTENQNIDKFSFENVMQGYLGALDYVLLR